MALGSMDALNELECDRNPIITPPASVLKGGLATIVQFFKDGAASGTLVNREVKVMVLGLSEAGKTSLIKALKSK